MDQEPDFLVNTTNDAWFGTTAAPDQHWAQVVVRAVESKRAIVRAANTGISGLVEPSGRISYASQIFTTTAFSVDVPLLQGRTIYSRYGDLLLVGCAIFLATHLYRQRNHSA
jgi:apolipoprotein N-acyltransferase